MIKVAALTPGVNTPSSRFRVRQFIAPLSKMGVEVTEYASQVEKAEPLPWIGTRVRARYVFPLFVAWEAAKMALRIPDVYRARRADIVWLQRELISGVISLEPFISRPLILDVDDAIWTSPPFGRSSMAKLAGMAEVVVVGNEYLANWFGKYAKRIEIVPTAIDTDKFSPAVRTVLAERFVVGWTGTGGNLSYLYGIEEPLSLFLAKHADAELHVISDRKAVFRKLPSHQVKCIAWSPEIEAVTLKTWDVGLMPLTDDEFTRGKCSFKMLQYMSTGLPVVASPIGMNGELLSRGTIGFSANSNHEWFQALEWLYIHRNESKGFGSLGREIVEREYSQSVVSKKLRSIIGSVAKTNGLTM